MSKTGSNTPRAAIHVGSPAKSFSAAEGNEPERRGWDEKMYKAKNGDVNNHYDFTRKHLNFEINTKGVATPLGSNPLPLHERLRQRLDELGFKPYRDKSNPMGNSDNSPNCTVGIIVSGDHDVLSRLAFGDQDVDYSLQRSNAHVKLKLGICEWAVDTYCWACRRWGAENIIGFDVHLDETTPHIHIQMIPVAKTKARGRSAVKYVHKDDKSKSISQKEWKKLPEEERTNYVRKEDKRRERECVSYARVWGEDKYAVGRTYYQMHTDYYNEVGRKYGLERGDDIFSLPEEMRRGRVHKSKAVLEAERQSMEAVAKAQEKKEEADRKLASLEDYVKAINVKREELVAPILKTDQLVKDAVDAIQEELEKPIPAFNQKEWRTERKNAIKQILTDMQTGLLKAKADQKEEILKLGKALYQEAMKNASAIVEKNRQLQRQNEQLSQENSRLRNRLSAVDETVVEKLRQQKDSEIRRLQNECDEANSHAARSENMASRERQRADDVEKLLDEVLAVSEIKEIWDKIQQNKWDFWQQMGQWIEDAKTAIQAFAKDYEHSDFPPEQGEVVAHGILAEAVKTRLDATDDAQRMKATDSLLSQVSWTGATEYMSDLSATRTRQLCQDMNVSKELMETIYLASGGRGVVCSGGGGGSDNGLTDWDGKRKRKWWER